MPSNLLNSSAGVIALRVAVMDQIERRIRRWFKRNTVVAFDDWVAGGKTAFSLQTVLGNLNQEHDEEVLNLLDALQQFEKQLIEQDYDVYVDSDNGNDITGIGTAAAPFQTIPRAQELIPETIASKVNVFLSGTFNNVLHEKRIIKRNGQLSYQGIDDPNVIAVGPYTINTWTPIGAGICGNQIAILGAPWIAENYRGKFVHMLDGAAQGAFFAISHNGVSDLMVGYVTAAPAPGDTFEIVEPGTSLTSIDFEWRINLTFSDSEIEGGVFGSSYILAGLKINTFILLSSSDYSIPIFPFCYIEGLYSYIFHCEINDWAWKDSTQTFNPRWNDNNTNNTFINIYISYGNFCRIAKTTIGTVYLNGTNSYIYRCAVEYITQNQTPNSGLFLYTSYLHNDGTKPIIETFNGGLNLTIDRGYVYQCTDIIYAQRCDIQIKNLQGNVAGVSGFALQIAPNSQISLVGALPNPAAGQVHWITSGATVPAPAIGASITDGHGSFVYRIS